MNYVYLAVEDSPSHADIGDHVTTNDYESWVDQVDSHGSIQPKRETEKPLTSGDYRTAFTNIAQGVVTDNDTEVLVSMLQSADSAQLSDGLKLVIKLSVSSAESKVISEKGTHFVPTSSFKVLANA